MLHECYTLLSLYRAKCSCINFKWCIAIYVLATIFYLVVELAINYNALSLVPRPVFAHGGGGYGREKLFIEFPIPFFFHLLECWQTNQVVLHK